MIFKNNIVKWFFAKQLEKPFYFEIFMPVFSSLRYLPVNFTYTFSTVTLLNEHVQLTLR